MDNESKSLFLNQKEDNFIFDYFEFEENCFANEIRRNNYYSLIWITEGTGSLKTGLSEHNFEGHNLFAFSRNQPFLILPETQIKGIVIDFSTEFIYITNNERERSFSENIYDTNYYKPFVNLDEFTISSFTIICEQIKAEMHKPSLAQHEILGAYLKILLINALRLKKKDSSQLFNIDSNNKEHYLIQKLKDAIDDNYRDKHSPSDYAEMLNVTVKTLTRISKSYFNRTVSDIINSKIITEAKRELNLTTKTVKEIAFELGYNDEYYFSRFFKINTNISPTKYRYSLTNSEAIYYS